jgi:hypothetical protein
VSADGAPVRFFELLRTLITHDVEFVIIGGFALGFHGAERATKDVDVVPRPSAENLTRLWAALEELEAEPQGLEDIRPKEMPMPWSLESLIEGGGNWILHTKFGRLDVMQWVEPFESYEQLRVNAEAEHLEEVGGTLLVAGFGDLVAMKEAAGREQDLMDIMRLRMAHGLEE